VRIRKIGMTNRIRRLEEMNRPEYLRNIPHILSSLLLRNMEVISPSPISINNMTIEYLNTLYVCNYLHKICYLRVIEQ
jgi:hypothetical protein